MNLRRVVAASHADAQNGEVNGPTSSTHNGKWALQQIDPNKLPPRDICMTGHLSEKMTAEQKAYVESLPPPAVLKAQLAATLESNRKLRARVGALKSHSSQLNDQYRRVVSLCTGMEESKVESMLEGLLAAVESEEGEGIEVGRVREFLRKVDGVNN